MSSKVWKTD